ncbi:MAG: aspartate aminotransferase [Elusimicrobia bacterium CG1_02_63_36]|nr:MAG: aspartate aminotransferase [Elusimicrobia bacterium CG1_02_63_36]PIP81862.1 MAG: aspartate aminotransferase [Elusimicrobia bacterium CG22_combo_CG10-13_8_21_14_all_63_91]PJA12604.1 MAG: aspartate aminotransferase [Elusimicrobia bacterium CG_4_10_14_0_2_um_filter_63_34]PJB25149.1 MAG: aspartate aminotransferase [Elusimicrobia bacterium CG_4_9_14_3_um_filter_62_55]
MALFSKRTFKIDTENAFKIGPHIAKVEGSGKKVVKFNLGEPDFDLPQYIKDEIKRQVDAGNTHYCDPQGILPLRQSLTKHLKKRGVEASADRLVVFPGGKPSIGLCQQAYLDPGDEVIYPSPGFPIYESFIRYVDAVPVPLHLKEELGFSFTGEDLAKLITPKTKLIILNFPSNPTGGVACQEQLESIAKVISEKCSPDVRIYSDEIYEDILFDGSKHISIASLPGMAERTVVASGFSKSYSWTGGRVGFALYPTAEEAQVFKNLNINYFSCIPPYNQEAARVALDGPERDGEIKKMVTAFQERRDYIVPALNAIDGVRCQNPKGAFYVFPNIEGVCKSLGAFELFKALPDSVRAKTSPSTLFQMFLLYQYGVAVMDRKSFGKIGAENSHFLRLSIANKLEELKLGVELIAKASQDKAGFEAFVKRGENLC